MPLSKKRSVSDNIRVLMREGKPQKQAIAIALDIKNKGKRRKKKRKFINKQ